MRTCPIASPGGIASAQGHGSSGGAHSNGIPSRAAWASGFDIPGILERQADLVVVQAQDTGGLDQVQEARGRPLLQPVHGLHRFPIGD